MQGIANYIMNSNTLRLMHFWKYPIGTDPQLPFLMAREFTIKYDENAYTRIYRYVHIIMYEKFSQRLIICV